MADVCSVLCAFKPNLTNAYTHTYRTQQNTQKQRECIRSAATDNKTRIDKKERKQCATDYEHIPTQKDKKDTVVVFKAPDLTTSKRKNERQDRRTDCGQERTRNAKHMELERETQFHYKLWMKHNNEIDCLLMQLKEHQNTKQRLSQKQRHRQHEANDRAHEHTQKRKLGEQNRLRTIAKKTKSAPRDKTTKTQGSRHKKAQHIASQTEQKKPAIRTKNECQSSPLLALLKMHNLTNAHMSNLV